MIREDSEGGSASERVREGEVESASGSEKEGKPNSRGIVRGTEGELSRTFNRSSL